MTPDTHAKRPVDRLLDALDLELGRDPKGPGVPALLAAYAAAQDDWRPYLFFDEHRYTRNRIARNEAFELLLLGWGAGQASPIHNHEGQSCWMAVLEGAIEEVRYPIPGDGHRGPLEPSAARVFGPGEVAFIRDEIGLHLVRPSGGAGVSLHLYAAPYDACNAYCPDTGRVERIPLELHSIRGRLV